MSGQVGEDVPTTLGEPVGGFLQGGGVSHAACNYLGAVVPDRGVWFCNKCGRGGQMSGRLIAAILDIDAHAEPMGEDDQGFVTGGYFVSIGSLHRALGVIGHTAPKCRDCGGHDQHELRDANYGMWNAMQRAVNHPEAWRDYVRPALDRYRTVVGGDDAEPT